MKKLLKLLAFGIVANIFAGCGANYSALGPILSGVGGAGSGSGCNGGAVGNICASSVAVGSVSCPGGGNDLLASTGGIVISGSNIKIAENIQAGNAIAVTGSNISISGTTNPNNPTSLNAVSPTVSNTGNNLINGSNYNDNIGAGDYYYGTFTISGSNINIEASGQVRIWFNQLIICGSNIDVEGNVGFFGTCGASVIVDGSNINFYGSIYSPTGPIELYGSNNNFYAPIVGGSVTIPGSNIDFYPNIGVCGLF